MALVPLALRPSVVVRRNAVRRGVLGPSTAWKVVAVVVFGRRSLKQFFGKHPEPLGTFAVRKGHRLAVSVSAPVRGLSRRERRRTLARLEEQAWEDVAAARRS